MLPVVGWCGDYYDMKRAIETLEGRIQNEKSRSFANLL